MKTYYFTYRSITHAQKASKVLERRGIRHALVRTPKHFGSSGCGYSVRVGARELEAAKNSISGYDGIYLQPETLQP